MSRKEKTYRAEFFTAADYAFHDVAARSPEHALQLARQLYDEHPEDLDFRSYDDNSTLDQIQIWDAERGTLAEWKSETFLVAQAAGDLLAALEGETAAAQAVLDRWAEGDLAGAVRELDAQIATARAAIAKAKEGRP
jgi:hypothetical protein